MSGSTGLDNSKRATTMTHGISKQNQRLTGRHIQALMQLQDVTLENEKLQSKLDFLEKELSSCFELHEIARDSQRTIENERKTHEDTLHSMKEEIYKEMEQEIHNLKEKHKQEKNQLKEMELKLQSRIRELKQQNNNYMEESQQYSLDSKRVQELEAKCKYLSVRLDEAEVIIGEKTSIEEELQQEVGSLRKENANMLSTLEKQKFLLLANEKRLEEEKSLREKLTDKHYAYKEINSLNNIVIELKQEVEEKDRTCMNLTDEKESLQRHVHDVENRLLLLELERDAVKQSADDLKSDVDFLRDQVSNVKIGHVPQSRPDGRKVSREGGDLIRKKSAKTLRSQDALLANRRESRPKK